MSDLTDNLRYAADHTSATGVTMGPPPRGSIQWMEIQCAEAADLIDTIDALHQQRAGFPDKCQQCVIEWPCPTHRFIHPEVEA